MAKFGGAMTALVTPMHEDESVDYEGFRALVKRQLEGGIDGILPYPDGINYAWVGTDLTHPDGWDSLGQVFKLSPATYNSLGGVIPDGNTMEVDENGVIKNLF